MNCTKLPDFPGIENKLLGLCDMRIHFTHFSAEMLQIISSNRMCLWRQWKKKASNNWVE